MFPRSYRNLRKTDMTRKKVNRVSNLRVQHFGYCSKLTNKNKLVENIFLYLSLMLGGGGGAKKPPNACSSLLTSKTNLALTRENEQTCLWRFVNKKRADQPAHHYSLISSFVIHLLESSIYRLDMSELRCTCEHVELTNQNKCESPFLTFKLVIFRSKTNLLNLECSLTHQHQLIISKRK